MMRNIIILMFVLLYLSCGKDKEAEHETYKIIGNWSMITNDSTYYEIKVDTTSILFYNYDASFYPLRPYRIKNDSLSMRMSENETKNSDYIIEYLDSTEFILKNDATKEKMKLFRIDSMEFTFDKIKNFEDEQLEFEVAHLNRKNKLLGIDYRYNLDSIKSVFDTMKMPKTETMKLIKD